MSYKTSLMGALMSAGTNRIDALIDGINDKVIDTCYTPDTGEWETAIEYNNRWYVVEHYGNNKLKASEGHRKWVKKCEDVNFIPEETDDIEYGF